jgi:hypothetical protein
MGESSVKDGSLQSEFIAVCREDVIIFVVLCFALFVCVVAV